MQTQSTVRTTAQGGVDGTRNQGVDVADDIRGTPDGDRADVWGSQGAVGEQMDLRYAAGTGDQGRVAETIIRSVTGASED